MTTYKTPDRVQADRLNALDEYVTELKDFIDDTFVDGLRRVSIAKTHIETAEMFLRKAIIYGDAE